MSKGIRVSKEFGLNPSVLHCECCGKEYGIGIFGTGIKSKETGKTIEAPHAMAHGLCDDCQKVVDQQGLLIIEVRDGESGSNPYRTGRIVGITKEAKERMFKDIKSPMCYMEQTMFTQMFGEAVK